MVSKQERSENKDIKKRLKKVQSSSKNAAKRIKKDAKIEQRNAQTQAKIDAAEQAIRIEAIKTEIVENSEAIYHRGRRGIHRFLRREGIEQNIFVAFVLNLFFSIFEFFGGALSGSIAIMADAVHDLGDAASIGFSYYCEKKSKRGADKTYTYGYTRYSVLGAFISTTILVVGSSLMIYSACTRFAAPAEIKTGWMIVLAIVGIIVNGLATFKTSGQHDHLNEHAVNLHMLEDVVTWVIVLFGAVVISVTGWTWLDPAMSICVSVALIGASLENYHRILDLFLEKVPTGTSVDTVRFQIMSIPHVVDVHHVHIWSMNEKEYYATMHVVVDGAVVDGVLLENSVENPENIKAEIRRQLNLSGIHHVTIELESNVEKCTDKNC